MDSMLCWDRRKTDARYDPALPNMTDLDFLLKLWATVPGGYHLGTPLHDYVKVPTSMSNAPGFTERMIKSKRLILERLGQGAWESFQRAGTLTARSETWRAAWM